MLSRLYDERVFTSSEDVVFSASSSQALRRNADDRPRSSQQRVASSANVKRTPSSTLKEDDEGKSSSSSSSDECSDDDDDEEASADDEMDAKRTAGLHFPMQSPRHLAASQRYLHRQRRGTQDAIAMKPASSTVKATAKAKTRGDTSSTTHPQHHQHTYEEDDNDLAMVVDAPPRKRITAQYHDRPMELVYLPTGEIRPRDECPPGLKLPSSTDVRKLLAAPATPSRQQNEQKKVTRSKEKKKRVLDTSVVSSTVHITRQNSAGEDRSEDDADEDDERPQPRSKLWAQRARNGEMKSKKTRARQNAAPSSTSGHSDHEEEEEEENEDNSNNNRHHRSAKTRARDLLMEKGFAVEDQRATGAEKNKNKTRRAHASSDDDDDDDEGRVQQRQSRRSNKESTRPVPSSSSSQRVLGLMTSTAAARGGAPMDVELQKEKKRVLEKMTQLLEEQGKTQALQHKLETYEAKMAAMAKQLEVSTRQDTTTTRENEKKMAFHDRGEQLKSFTNELRAKDEQIHRLQNQLLDQQHVGSPTEKRQTRRDDDKINRLKQSEAALAKQLEELMKRVTVFHSHVETWKTNSREAVESCEKKMDVLELLDRLWIDFPQFLSTNSNGNSAKTTATTSGSTSASGESSTISFLTTKLRQKEDELRLTHVKYVELKELCARQCIREADLQNFINDHRLRGNLVIRNGNGNTNATQSSNSAPVAEHTASNGGAAARAPRHHHVATFTGQENRHDHANGRRGADPTEHYEDDGHEDNEENDEDVVVRRPRVFIDITRANESEIEHVRLAPSPGLAQRYHQQQLQQQQQFQDHQQQPQHPQRQTQQRRTKGVVSGAVTGTSRVATVASASRSLATTRQSYTRASTTTTSAATRASVSTQKRPSTSSRHAPLSRRPSSQAPPPLTSRPWV